MSLKLYADTPSRRTRQIASDVWFLVWAALWIWLASRLREVLLTLSAPAQTLESAGQSFADNMTQAGSWLAGVPIVGGTARAPFDTMSQAGRSIAEAAQAQQDVVDRLALVLPALLAFLAIAVMLVMWLPLRIRFIVRAKAAQRYLDNEGDVDLFALRALARQPLTALAEIHPDPAGAWRRKDPSVVWALADLELRAEGLRMPEQTYRT